MNFCDRCFEYEVMNRQILGGGFNFFFSSRSMGKMNPYFSDGLVQPPSPSRIFRRDLFITDPRIQVYSVQVAVSQDGMQLASALTVEIGSAILGYGTRFSVKWCGEPTTNNQMIL